MIHVNGQLFEQKFFGDGTPKMLQMDNYTFKPLNIIRWHFDNIGENVFIEYLVRYIKDVRRQDAALILPYVPNARMDRVKNPIKELHTLKYFCRFINSLDFKRVVVDDVHSPVTLTLLDRVAHVNAKNNIERVLDKAKVDYFFFPDAGAHQRYTEYLDMRPSFFGEKIRNWATGRIEGYKIVDAPILLDMSVLIVDDICAYGGTFHHAANALKDAGVSNIYLYVTHCENDILKGDLINNDNVDQIFTTNSIYREDHPKIELIP